MTDQAMSEEEAKAAKAQAAKAARAAKAAAKAEAAKAEAAKAAAKAEAAKVETEQQELANEDQKADKATGEESSGKGDDSGSQAGAEPISAAAMAAADTAAADGKQLHWDPAAGNDYSASQGHVKASGQTLLAHAIKKRGNQGISKKTLKVINHGARSFEIYTRTPLLPKVPTIITCKNEAEYLAVLQKFNQLNKLAQSNRYEILED